MPDPPVLIERVRAHFAPRDLDGQSILVTAGPTREAIDPVRYISNRSSGRMGYAMAEAAQQRGAAVTLVSGPTTLAAPSGVSMVRVTTAAEMLDAVMGALPSHRIVVKAAAVADYAPEKAAATKIKKERGGEELTLTLRKNPDILSQITASAHRPFVVAFAAETDSVEQNAREKLRRKDADLVVANDVSDSSIGFDSDQNEVVVLARDGSATRLARAPKIVIANRILDLVVSAIGRKR